MKKEDLSKYYGEYKTKCACGNELSVLAQSYTLECEYHEEIFIECKECKELVQFVISIN
jgi:hypothetical protein